jgi:hypothetical protein
VLTPIKKHTDLNVDDLWPVKDSRTSSSSQGGTYSRRTRVAFGIILFFFMLPAGMIIYTLGQGLIGN